MSDIYIARSAQVASRLLGGEMIIMSAVDSTLFNLNAAGTLIWQAADGKTSLATIVEQRICPLFEVGPEEALRDAQEFVSELATSGILLVSEKSIVDRDAVPVQNS
jgi:hypothetical protein